MAVWSSSLIRLLEAFDREQRHASRGVVNHKTMGRLSRSAVWDTAHHVGRTPRGSSTSALAAGAGGGDAEIGFQHRAIAGKLGARPLVNNRAALDDRHPIGHAEHLLGILLDQDRRHAFIAD